LLKDLLKLEVSADVLDEIEDLIARVHSRDLIELVRSSCAKLGDGESS